MQEHTQSMSDPRRRLVSVNALLEQPAIQHLVERYTRDRVLESITEVLDEYRRTLRPGDTAPGVEELVEKVRENLAEQEFQRIRPVVNATGIILHTGLGRAVLPKNAATALGKLDRCCNLQMDLETGKRGKRCYMTEHLLTRITGAEAAMVVNNNAAATLLIISALCQGKELIISRGQLIEIGGSYRLPDCIHQSGAIMVEVGTTNKTHLRDYERAMTENTGMVLRCNPSNYRVVGFSQQVPIRELVKLKEKQPVYVVDDLGCGALIDLEQYGLPKEPTVQESIAAGADLVCSSGDKLIGGAQAGIIVGKRELIALLKKHPLSRMLRVCKLTDTALEHTLGLFLDPDTVVEKNPTLRMIAMPLEELKARARKLKRRINREKLTSISIEIREDESATGGGSLPTASLKTYVLAVTSPEHSAEEISRRLRRHEPPVIARIKHDNVMLDMRTLLEGEDSITVDALKSIDK